ncbi:hypothetical protein GCM10011428_78230 [Streptomyces violaceus]|uniref:nitrate- and nitrite sensing domain-containing protein n=1 Tax=Streptomyces violaceus TaxID=1936 RepID=UPI0031EC08EC
MPVTRATERLRPRSVRAKIVALLMLPIVSLMALWGFAAVTTASSIGDTERVKDVNAELLAPVDEFVTALQAERTAVTRHAAAPDSAGLDTIEEARKATDEAATAVRNGADAAAADAELLDAGLPARIDRLEADTRGLTALRARTDTKGAAQTAFTGYSTIIEDAFAVTGALTGENGTHAASEARVVLELARAREAVAQEQSLLAAGSGAGESSPRSSTRCSSGPSPPSGSC